MAAKDLIEKALFNGKVFRIPDYKEEVCYGKINNLLKLWG